MRRRLTLSRVAVPLPGSLVDLLLGGWDAILDVDPAIDQSYDTWAVWDVIDYALPWHEHRAWLLEEWRRRGGIGEPWGARFDTDGDLPEA